MNREKLKNYIKTGTIKHFCFLLISALILTLACGNEAKTLLPDEYTIEAPTSTTTGYYYPEVQAAYPNALSTDIPSNTKIIIIFNMPIDQSDLAGAISITRNGFTLTGGGADYTMATTPRTATITFTAALADADIIAVVVANTVRDFNDTVYMPSNYTFGFTVPAGANADTTAPVLSAAGTPAGGGAPRIGSISVSFNEDIDFSTVNSATFRLRNIDTGDYMPAIYGYNAGTNTIYLYPAVQLAVSTNYTVYLETGIKNISGLSYAGSNWSFTTVATNIDPVAGNPVIDGPVIISLAPTELGVTWNTDQVTSYVFHYGMGDDTALSSNQTDYRSSRFLNLTGLIQGARYWYYVSCTDLDGNTTSSSPMQQVNLLTGEAPSTLSAGANNQYSLVSRPYYSSPSATTDGVILFWADTNATSTRLYGRLFSSVMGDPWGASKPLFANSSTNYTFEATADDGLGGVIVLACTGTNQIYAKRYDLSGAMVNWGTAADESPTDGLDTGILIDSGVNAGAAVVYQGMIEPLLSGQVDEGGLAMTYPFFEDMSITGNPLANYASDNDILYKPASDTATFIDMSLWDHSYVLGQDTSGFYTASTAFILAGGTAAGSSTIRNHDMNVTDRNENDKTFYLVHGATPTVAIGSIVLLNGTQYMRVSAYTPLTFSALDSGTESAQNADHLYDVNGNFTGVTNLNQYDVVIDTSATPQYAIITAPVSYSSDLTLSSSIFTATEGYSLYNRVKNNTAGVGSGAGYVYKLGEFASGVADGDLIFKVNSTYTAILGGPYPITITTISTITFNSSLVINENEYFIIVSQTPLALGAADNGASIIVNIGANWSGVTAASGTDGDLVRNTSASAFAYVTEKSATVLKLSSDIFSGSSQGYAIYHEFCRTHNTYTEQVAGYYEIVLDDTISPVTVVADGNSAVFYNAIITWTSDASNTFPTNPFYENDFDLTTYGFATGGTLGDVVFNYSSGTNAYIDTGSYAIHQYAMSLSSDIFTADGQDYRIYGFYIANTYWPHVADSGIADSTTSYHLTDASHFGSVTAGDVVFNASNSYYSLVTAVASGSLTLANDIFTNNNPYLVTHRCGVLYAWQDPAGGVYAKILALDLYGAETEPAELVPENTIDSTATNPWVIPDGYGNAYLIYLDTTDNDIQVNFYNMRNSSGILTLHWTAEIDTNTLDDEFILDVRTDGEGGFVIMYMYGSELRVQRIVTNSHFSATAVSRLWGATGRLVTSSASLAEPSMAYDKTNDAVVVSWTDGVTDIYARRVGSTSSSVIQVTNLATVQRRSSVYVNNAGTRALVVWDDNRFVDSSGYGVFGMRLDIDTGTGAMAKSSVWNANGSGTADTDGVAIVLDSFNENATYPLLVPVNNNSTINLFWTDYQTSANGSDLLYMNPFQTYVPSF